MLHNPGKPYAHWWNHDCDRCIHLGSTAESRVDVYFCPGTLGGTFLARYGNEPSKYSSWPMVVFMQHWERRNFCSDNYQAVVKVLEGIRNA